MTDISKKALKRNAENKTWLIEQIALIGKSNGEYLGEDLFINFTPVNSDAAARFKAAGLTVKGLQPLAFNGYMCERNHTGVYTPASELLAILKGLVKELPTKPQSRYTEDPDDGSWGFLYGY